MCIDDVYNPLILSGQDVPHGACHQILRGTDSRYWRRLKDQSRGWYAYVATAALVGIRQIGKTRFDDCWPNVEHRTVHAVFTGSALVSE